jgi:hypothetical protein
MSRKNHKERLFQEAAVDAGLSIEQPPSIRIEEPIFGPRGKQKTVTTPDFKIIDPRTGQTALVEVTNGRGNTPHKRRQRKIAQKAGVENYVQVSGKDVEKLAQESDPNKVRTLMFALLGWILSK